MIFSARPLCVCLVLIFAFASSLPSRSTQSNGTTASSLENRRRQLLSVFEEEWEYELRTSPEFATMLGDSRYNDRLSDNSPEFFQADLEQKKKFLARIQAIDPNGFTPQDALSRELMIRELNQEIEGAQFKRWEMPVNQMGGVHLELADLVELTPFKTVGDYENYLARLHQLPHAFDQLPANMQQGMPEGLMPLRYLLEKDAAEPPQRPRQRG